MIVENGYTYWRDVSVWVSSWYSHACTYTQGRSLFGLEIPKMHDSCVPDTRNLENILRRNLESISDTSLYESWSKAFWTFITTVSVWQENISETRVIPLLSFPRYIEEGGYSHANADMHTSRWMPAVLPEEFGRSKNSDTFFPWRRRCSKLSGWTEKCEEKKKLVLRKYNSWWTAGEMDTQADRREQILSANKHFRLQARRDDHNTLFLHPNLQTVCIHV